MPGSEVQFRRSGEGPALRSLARGFASRTGLLIRYSSIPDSIAQTEQVALALLRVAQEALLNVHRHAQALHVQMTLTMRERMLELTVRDDGVGIPPDRLKKLGEPFYTTKETGNGLGLMVSFKIIESHQGRIVVESEVNKGTAFNILLPLETA